MTNMEKAMREIVAKTQFELKKYDEKYILKVKHNKRRCRFEVQVLMGRHEFEEIYCLADYKMNDDFWVQTYYDHLPRQIATNLKLNKYLWR